MSIQRKEQSVGYLKSLEVKGGAGSGHFGHAGIIGHRGGSADGSGRGSKIPRARKPQNLDRPMRTAGSSYTGAKPTVPSNLQISARAITDHLRHIKDELNLVEVVRLKSSISGHTKQNIKAVESFFKKAGYRTTFAQTAKDGTAYKTMKGYNFTTELSTASQGKGTWVETSYKSKW